MGPNLRLFILEHSLAFKCYLNELNFPGFQAQRYMFRLMTLSFFFLAANRALIHLIEGETSFFFAQVAIS